MMGILWVVLLVALSGVQVGQGLPLRSTPHTYPHDPNDTSLLEAWGSGNGLYAAIPALALVLTAVGLLFGCTWCYQHKDCKPNEGADNQLFSASATHLHDGRRPPDPGFAEPVNNNISEDNNNGPISLREMQNIANNNATAYIISENEERNRVSRESVVEFEPLPNAIRAVDPLEHCADWFGGEDLPRNRLQYLREIGRGWFGRVVEGEIENNGTTTVAVKILNQNASLEDKARFLDESRLYRDVTHENILAFIAKCLQEDPWILMFELCSTDLQQYLVTNRPKMAILNESGAPLQLMCDIASALNYLHSRGYTYGNLSSNNILVREASSNNPRGVLGCYAVTEPQSEFTAPETRRHPPVYTVSSEVWSLGSVIWEVCSWGAPLPPHLPPPPDLPCVYRNHLYQVMQLCWNPNAEARPTAGQVHALLNHLHTSQSAAHAQPDAPADGSGDFEERWQRLKPNTIPKVDEHVALVHAPSTSMASHFTGSDQELDRPPTAHDTLSIDMDTAVSRSSSIMSDKDPLSVQIKSESLTNLHGSLEDVRNIFLTHNETAVLECHQGNISFEDRERELDRSDSSVDPWIKDLIAGSQDDVSYYKDVSDVIKNLDNILNSEKTSSSESSHQASPSRDNLSLDCKKDHPVQSCLVKSPGITNFQNILEMGLEDQTEGICGDEEIDRDTVGTLSHSFERHSDSTSQHTLANLTPDTPMKDFDVVTEIEEAIEVNTDTPRNLKLPKENIDSSYKLPKLKDLCVVSLCSVSDTNEQLNVREDCETSCDSNLDEILRTQVKTKSVDNTDSQQKKPTSPVVSEANTVPKFEIEISAERVQEVIHEVKISEVSNETEEDKELSVKKDVNILEIKEIAKNFVEKEIIQPAIDVASKMVQENTINGVYGNNLQNSMNLDVRENENTEKPTEKVNTPLELTRALIEEERKVVECFVASNVEAELKMEESNLEEKEGPPPPTEMPLLSISTTKTPDPVQIVNDKDAEDTKNIINKSENLLETEVARTAVLPSDLVQNVNEDTKTEKEEEIQRSEDLTTEKINQSNDSTVYMDLTNYMNSEKDNDSEILQDGNIKELIQSCVEHPDTAEGCSMNKTDESTVYLDLPSVLKETHEFSQEEIMTSQLESSDIICASTPKGSECSADNTSDSKETTQFSEIKVPADVAAFKAEQKFVQELLSPFDSPTKSHPTDTYDENSSVVLGSLENCSMEYRGTKMEVDLPKEELLAFSSNFSEINLETPSPLRDGNFLNEVPDIISDDLQFEDLTLSEAKKEEKTEDSDETDQSGTAKHVSPSTPPNSPGIYLASTSHQKYVVDIDLEAPGLQSYPPMDSDSGLSSLQKDIDLNQIELQITTKLAMAENENNMNIEYSGPLTVEGLVSEDEAILRESEATPEAFLAGNGFDENKQFPSNEDCMKALRNELELKLPLAQVAGIEPAPEPEWSSLPPPPELIVRYGVVGALSPIQEETKHQLNQYENDAWNASNRTDSSESYPEPCNDSTAEVTELPTASQAAGSNENSTYTLHSNQPSGNNTYTVQKDIPSSKEFTMSADSLNGSPFKKPPPQSPIDDKTYNKNEDDKVSNCERISQVSPFLMSPTTDTSAPDDNVTGVSTLSSKTTLPTDAKHSKPTELSKATSIDSWCSNDTLYNVEENFDDLVLDTEVPQFENVKAKSASTETLTRIDEEKDASHCSTYIVHDSKTEPCDTFSPDSITPNDNNTYTKIRTEVTGPTPSFVSTEVDSKNSQTKDLAYGTLPSYSNCSTELISSIDNPWQLPQPEMVRRSPVFDEVIFTPPKLVEDKETVLNDSPQILTDSMRKMESMDATCLQDEVINSVKSDNPERQNLEDTNNHQYRHDMLPLVSSTPKNEFVEEDSEDMQDVAMNFTEEQSGEILMNSPPMFQSFFQSAEVRPQDIWTPPDNTQTSSNQDTHLLLEGESKTACSNLDSMSVADRTPTYSDFEYSVVSKPQELHSKSSQNMESGMSSGDFRQFENSVRCCPQDLSSVIDTNSLFLDSERKLSETSNCNTFEQPSRTEPAQSSDVLSPIPNLIESHPPVGLNMYITDLDEEETEQPHSIIITEVPVRDIKHGTSNKTVESVKKNEENCNITYDSHEQMRNLNHTYDSHAGVSFEVKNDENVETKVNGTTKLKSNETFDSETENTQESTNGKVRKVKKTKRDIENQVREIGEPRPTCNGNSQNYATVHFINESFEELVESNVDGNKDTKSSKNNEDIDNQATEIETPLDNGEETQNGHVNGVEERMAAVTEDFLQNEKKFCTLDSYLPLLSDIRFTGPATDIMSTTFSGDQTVKPVPESEQDSKPDAVADIVKEWDSDSESHSSNSSSGEFIWKDGDGHETSVVPTTHFDHQQRGNESQGNPPENNPGQGGGAYEGSGDSGSGSEGDEVEFVPSSWDCRAAPSKSSLRSLEQTLPTDSKKRVVFKRQKYHCVYEYPRELAEAETHSPAYLPDLSTYCEWDPTSAEEAELGYGQLYGAPMDMYQLRSGIAFSTDYDEDFFISSSARPFESFGIMSTSSQFFPGMHMKSQLLERDPLTPEQGEFPAPPSPLPTTTLPTRTPSLDFTTPDSGVEDITPGSTSTDEDFKIKKLPESEAAQCWRPVDSGSSSESVSPSSPGGEALGGLRHTRDKLKLDLPPSPHIPSPRHNRVFNFVLDKPKRHRIPDERPAEIGNTPLVMTDETPVITSTLPIQKDEEDVSVPEPTFSTFGKGQKSDPESEQKIILSDEAQESPSEEKEEVPVKVEPVKGEGTVLDSGDEDSGIESSSKATLERKANVS